MKIGLFFGSFNPIHVGHLIIANYVYEVSDLQQVWFVVSPHNPLKDKRTLLSEYDRLHLVNLGIDDNPHLKSSNIEFKLPQPSYTIDTLVHLKEKYPQHEFSLIMGGDNITNLHKWKNYELLLRDYAIYVYKRDVNQQNPYPDNDKVKFLNVPYIDISATFIRENLRNGISMQYFLPEKVFKYITAQNLYK